MKKHLNTLFVTKDNTYLRKDGSAIEVRQEGNTLLRIPFHNLDGIVAMGWDIGASAQLMAACSESNITLSFCTPYGKFMTAVRGFTHGNVLLRRDQYRSSDNENACIQIAAPMIAAKIANSRAVLSRHLRDHGAPETIEDMVRALAHRSQKALSAETLEELRGMEGDSAKLYFSGLAHIIRVPGFEFSERVRRPPTDRFNCLLSFCYSLLAHDCRSALETVGLDPAVGFLHRDRPGRPSLALDLMEELRPVMADRCVLAMINRRQLTPDDFITRETGAIELKEDSRKKVLVEWQERKQEEITHPFIDEKITFGILPMIQARLLAKAIRKDLDAYPPFFLK